MVRVPLEVAEVRYNEGFGVANLFGRGATAEGFT